jgi:hypothetical protein
MRCAGGGLNVEDMTKRMNLGYLVAPVAALALLPLLAACGGGGQRDTAALTYRGVTYDTGTQALGEPLAREVWSTERMKGEIAAIADRLHANSISVFGTDVHRLVDTATAALERGLHVWIQPRLYDGSQAEVLAHLARTAREAERLRKKYSRVSLNVGVESTIFTPGIIPGKTWWERIKRLSTGRLDYRALERRLNAFLAHASAVAREHFHGKITYSAGPWEAEGLNWSLFDYVGLDYYAFHPKRAEYVRELSRFRRFGKPIVITEFGTNAFEGAPKLEGDGWAIVDYSKHRPEIPRKYVRNEKVQADYLAEMLAIFESQHIYAAYVYTFISPDAPYSPSPRFDYDLASFAVVKVIRDHPWVTSSPYHWEPKQAFEALAEHYGAAR